MTSTQPLADGSLDAARRGGTVSVCIPARNEADTVGTVVSRVRVLLDEGVVDELVVVDDGSCDETAALARRAGAAVVESPAGPGKGQALAAAVSASTGDIVVFLDADVTNFSATFVTALVEPLAADSSMQLVKAAYRRACHGRPDEGGRVTELLARPLLRRFFPELADLRQPLSGECALRRSVLDGLELAPGYGVEIALLIDVFRRFGAAAITEVELGERRHRNRPLRELRPHADDVLAAVLDRATATRPWRPKEYTND